MAVYVKEKGLSWGEVVELLEHFTYKPNFRFEASHGDQGVLVHLMMLVPDAYGSSRFEVREDVDYDDINLGDGRGRTLMTSSQLAVTDRVIKVGGAFPVPVYVTRERFYDWLRNAIMDLEHHEMDEWFKVDGVAVRDPHKTA